MRETRCRLGRVSTAGVSSPRDDGRATAAIDRFANKEQTDVIRELIFNDETKVHLPGLPGTGAICRTCGKRAQYAYFSWYANSVQPPA